MTTWAGPPPQDPVLSVAALVFFGITAWLGGSLVERELENELLAEEETEPELIHRRKRR